MFYLSFYISGVEGASKGKPLMLSWLKLQSKVLNHFSRLKPGGKKGVILDSGATPLEVTAYVTELKLKDKYKNTCSEMSSHLQ